MLSINVSHIIFINYITITIHTIKEEEDNLILNNNTNNYKNSLLKRNKALRQKLDKKYRHVCQLEKRIHYLEAKIYFSQSGVVSDSQPSPGLKEEEMATVSDQQITAFADQDAGWTTSKVGGYDSTMDLANNGNSALGNFLERPIRQSAQTWTVGTPFFYKFNPWRSFCENTFVRDKIKNYELLRMKLHVKFVISGTKFHYGRAIAAYNPYNGGDFVTTTRNFISQDLIQASQKPHIFLNPTKNTGGQLDLPFFFPKNYMSISSADWYDMGEIVISSFGNLLHANGGDDPITITTYIWAEDIVLTAPTSSDPPVLTSQNGRRGGRRSSSDEANTINVKDEYGQGIISKPATAVAKAAGALTHLPIIGPYMTATQIGANASGRIASLFGYSRPNIVSDVVLTKPSPTGNLANTDAADAAVKLTMDSKAELTVDSRTVGLDGTDEMGILDYCTRESYLTQFDWEPNLSPDTLLWNTRVCPMQLDNVNSEIHMTPLAHMSTVFSYWQGSLKFRFQIVKSDFHKGRILVRWDPNAHTSTINYNTNYSRVIDIAETDDFEIVVGWGRALPFLPCGLPYDTGSNFSAVQRLLPDDTCNGMLELAVLNDLVCPSVDAPISINVFVSACDDYKLAVPNNEHLIDYHLFNNGDPGPSADVPDAIYCSQSSEPNVETGATTVSDKPTAPSELTTIGSKSDQDDPTYNVFFGDPPSSIRELCKRYTYSRLWWPESASANAVRMAELTNKDMPYYTGADSGGIDDGVLSGQLTIGPTAFSSWFAPQYAGVRGGYRKKYMINGGDAPTVPIVQRRSRIDTGNGAISFKEFPLAAPVDYIQKICARWAAPYSGNGCAATNTYINNTLEVELPFYMNKRFASPRILSAQDLDCNSHAVMVSTGEIGNGSSIRNHSFYQFDAVAEDWSLFFFTGVPRYWKYTLDENSNN